MLVSRGHNHSRHAVGLTVLHADNGSLAHTPATSSELLVSVLVLLFAAYVGFVNLDRTGEQWLTGLSSLADTH